MSRPFTVVRHPTARRVSLKLDSATGQARLVVPRRASLTRAIAWAEERADWLAAARANLPAARPFVPGMTLTVDDRPLRFEHDAAGSRRTTADDGVVRIGGPAEAFAGRAGRWLRGEALALLDRETRDVAARCGVAIERVAVGDPRGRWGSCSATGAIRYSWRLILAPRFVRQATVAHEVAHRIHMNHGAAFHVLAAELNGGDPAAAHAWLRAHGAALHWYGVSGA